MTGRELPEGFLNGLRKIERSCLAECDPIRQSGFGGGAARWEEERRPILEAVSESGDFLDIGCANGYLLECLQAWGKARGVQIEPHGLDWSEGLVALARCRFPRHASHFHVGNAWDWSPPRRYRFVYALHDCVPSDYLAELAERLLARVVAFPGRLILGAYGSRSRGERPFDVADFWKSRGHALAGRTTGGVPPVAAFAWIDAPEGSR